MKNYYLFIVFIVFTISCNHNNSKNQKSSDTTVVEDVQYTSILDKIADNYGIENWQNVNQLKFSFVVNPGEKESVRTWDWSVKEDNITLYKSTDTITYSRSAVNEENMSADRAFVNDSFWLLFPFHLVWDNVEHEIFDNIESPLLKMNSTKIRVNYPKEGGYTPGDSYEIYVDETYNIIEWSYHPKGQAEAVLSNTFEGQKSIGGIKFDLEHSNPETGFQLNFRDVEIN